MGRFSLTAHVSVLLERILQNISDISSKDRFREPEAKVLDDTVAALTSLAPQEARSRGFNVCSPVTACYSARILLHDPERALAHRASPRSDNLSHSAMIQSEIAAAMLQIARASTPMHCGEEDYTPFCFEAQYRAGVFFARRYSTGNDHEDLDALETIKNMLAMAKCRWRVAGLYHQMLEARHLSGIL